MAGASDQDLLDAVARGDARAFDALYARHGTVVARLLHRMPLRIRRGEHEPGDVAELRGLIQALWYDAVALGRLRDGARRGRETLEGWDETARLVAVGLGLEGRP